MNLLWKKVNPYSEDEVFDILRWKQENVKYWVERFPAIIDSIFQPMNEVSKRHQYVKCEVNVPLSDKDKPEFAPNNIVKAVITFYDKTKGESRDIPIFIPVPDPKFDYFIVNNNYYYLMPELSDKPIVAYQNELRIHSILIDQHGFLHLKNKKIPLFKVVNAFGLNEVLGYEVKIIDRDEYLQKRILYSSANNILPLPNGNYMALIVKKDRFTEFEKLVLKSLVREYKRSPKRFNPNEKDESAYRILNEYSFSPIFREIIGKPDLPEKGVFDQLLLLGREEYAKNYNKKFVNLSTKRVAYLDRIFDTFCVRLYKLRQDLITRHQQTLDKLARLDANDLCKRLLKGNRFFQTPNIIYNIYKEMDYRFKVLLCVENAPTHYRTVDASHLFNIDPIETPDRETIGVVLHFSVHVKLDKYGYFVNLPE